MFGICVKFLICLIKKTWALLSVLLPCREPDWLSQDFCLLPGSFRKLKSGFFQRSCNYVSVPVHLLALLHAPFSLSREPAQNCGLTFPRWGSRPSSMILLAKIRDSVGQGHCSLPGFQYVPWCQRSLLLAATGRCPFPALGQLGHDFPGLLAEL